MAPSGTPAAATVQRTRVSEFVRYLVAGGVAAGMNFGTRFIFSNWLPFEWAVACAYVVGMITAFLLMRGFAFRAGTHGWVRQAATFTAVNFAAVAQTLVVSSLFLRVVLPGAGIDRGAEAIAHAVGVLVPVVTSYFGHKLFTFR
jgi:putative flippase GtrA